MKRRDSRANCPFFLFSLFRLEFYFVLGWFFTSLFFSVFWFFCVLFFFNYYWPLFSLSSHNLNLHISLISLSSSLTISMYLYLIKEKLDNMLKTSICTYEGLKNVLNKNHSFQIIKEHTLKSKFIYFKIWVIH